MKTHPLKILAIDPAYHLTGIYFDKTFFSIENKCSIEDEDFFLYQFGRILREIVDKNKIFLGVEYTYVPHFKAMSPINRVIGAILSSLHKRLDGWSEIDMNSIYSFFKAKKGDKFTLREKIEPEIRKDLGDGVYFIEYIIKKPKVESNERIEDVEVLVQDCVDAYAIFLYIKEKFK